MSEEFRKFESLADQLKAYVNTRVSQAKLSLAEKVSKLAAMMIAMLMSALVFFLFLVLLCVAGALLIGQWLGSAWLGFLVVAGLVLLLGMILWLARDRLLRIPIMNALIEAMFDSAEEDEKD
ncbi:MAG: phage holin family protein [Sphingobacteriales bacterium]|nr:phage holin family protein [Sphingobacteriales bacterium]